MVTRAVNDTGLEEVHIDNKAYEKTTVTMTVSLAYTSLMLFNKSVARGCTRKAGRLAHPIGMLLKVVQVAGQCVVYDKMEKLFKPDGNC